jgi:hypothetical protein
MCSALGGSGGKRMLEWMESEGMVGDLRDEKYQMAITLIEQGRPMGKGSQHNIRSAQRLQEEGNKDALKPSMKYGAHF